MHEFPWVADKKRLSLVRALEDIEKNMSNHIQDRKTKRIPLSQDSTVGDSSLATMGAHFNSSHKMKLNEEK